MPLVNAKCTNCGANLEVDNTKDALNCPYCGSAFIVEKAINNYNTTNNIRADTVNIYGGTSTEFVITAGELKKYNGASADVIIPNTVRIIGPEVFSGCVGLTSVTIPDSVTVIGYSAFYSCSDLTSVTIPNSVTAIGEMAFACCTGLTSVTISGNVTEIGKAAFVGCRGLTSVTIPNSVTSIESEVFEECTGLKSVTIQNGVTKIDKNAFKDCTALTSVSIPNSVISIGDSAFEGCASLTSVTIPDGVTTIGESAFEGCRGLTSMTIPNSVKDIEYSAFKGCTGLTSVTIPDHFAKNDFYVAFPRNVIIVGASGKWRKKVSGCYIATCVYGSYDCPNVWTLRRFRDDTLDRTVLGRAFIKCYYAISPKLVKRFGDTKWFKKFWKAFLDRLVDALNKNGVANTKYVDKY